MTRIQQAEDLTVPDGRHTLVEAGQSPTCCKYGEKIAKRNNKLALSEFDNAIKVWKYPINVASRLLLYSELNSCEFY